MKAIVMMTCDEKDYLHFSRYNGEYQWSMRQGCSSSCNGQRHLTPSQKNLQSRH